jgi:hypothetical protein
MVEMLLGYTLVFFGIALLIEIEEGRWHLGKAGPLSLPRPPLVNRLIRGGLPFMKESRHGP